MDKVICTRGGDFPCCIVDKCKHSVPHDIQTTYHSDGKNAHEPCTTITGHICNESNPVECTCIPVTAEEESIADLCHVGAGREEV